MNMSKCKITGKVLAVQLGRDETQIALMGKGSEILHSVVLSTPAGAVEDGMIRNPDAVRGMLKSALNVPEFKRVRQAVFTLSTSQVITETVTIPDLPVQKVEKLLQANVDTYFPVDMAEYQLVWQIIGPKNSDNGLKELAVQLWAVPTAMVSRYYHVANACGLSVEAIDYCGHSIATAVGASFARPGKAKEHKKLNLNQEISFGRKKQEEAPAPAAASVATETRTIPGTHLHISLESDLIGMTFVQDGQVVHQRFVQCGANPAFQFGEVAMMVEYFRSLEFGRGSAISGTVSGTLALDKHLTDELADTLGIDLDLFEGESDPRWAMCAGAVRTTLDFGVPALNRPGKARKQVESQLWQYALVLLGGAVLVAVVLYTLSSRLVWNSEINSLESTKQTLTIQAQKSAGYADNYKKYASLYDSYSADWDTVFNSLRTYNDNLVLMLEELENTLPENSSVVNLQIAADGMTVQFACETKEEAAYLIMALRELQYADLTSISNLSGGGAGPATSYGPVDSGIADEDPPTEGSSFELTTEQLKTVISLVAAGVDEEVMELAMNLTAEQVTQLVNAYGTQPETSYESLAALKEANDVTFTQRSNAADKLLTENVITMKRFVELLYEDSKSDPSLLVTPFLKHCNKTGNSDIVLWMLEWLSEGTVEDTDTALEYYQRSVDIIIHDEALLTCAEELFCTDSSMEQWYIYYLEVEMGLREELVFPYLNMDKVVEDLLTGGFNTGDAELDEKLNGIISDDVWELLDQLKNAGSDDPTLPGGFTEEELMDLLNKYLTEGTTGNEILDALITNLINNYITTGSTGYAQLDKLIEEYLKNIGGDDPSDPTLPGGFTEAEIAELVEKYLTTGTTGNDVLDGLVEKYLKTGTTGNDVLDGLIEDYLSSTAGKAMIEKLVQKYINSGTTGVDLLDQLIYKYSTTGTTGNAVLDALIKEYLNKYLNDYINGGNTNGDDLSNLIGSLLGGNTGTGTTVTDTRIFFTVTLSYKEELKEAELVRKGLSEIEKIPRLEVTD